MLLASSYQARHALPNRSPTARPLSLSLNDYQPLVLDREALEASYQQSLLTRSNASLATTGSASTESSIQTHSTANIPPGPQSTLSHHLKTGENPHLHRTDTSPNFAGVGAGHSMSPSPGPHQYYPSLSQGTADQRGSLLSPVPASPSRPNLPPRPARPMLPERNDAVAVGPSVPPIRRTDSAMDVDGESYASAGYFGANDGESLIRTNAKGKKRALPPVPSNVPIPEPPEWEPDYKSTIPQTLTAPSAQNAYARLSAPPPNLPPRRTQPLRQASHHRDYNETTSRPGAISRPSGAGPSTLPRSMSSQNVISGNRGDVVMASSSNGHSESSAGHMSTYSRPTNSTVPSSNSIQMMGTPPPGAPDFPPITEEPMGMDGSVLNPGPSPVQAAPRAPRPQAEKEVTLHATGTTPIWSTHYLDPFLSSSLVMLPPQITSVANAALSAASSGKRKRFSTTTGAPIDGVAREIKDWIVPPDGRFVTDQGAVELGVAVIDSGVEEWGKEMGRKKGRVEVVSKHGGVKVDIIEIDPNRQIDLRVETKSGDVLILLPDNFHGPIHVTSPAHPPTFLPILTAQLKAPVSPYPSFFTTFVVPLHLQSDPKHSESLEHNIASKIHKFVPKNVRDRSQSNYMDMARDGYSSWSRGEQSKVSIQCARGRVVLGYRESMDEESVKSMGLKVGVRDVLAGSGKKGKKRWWRS